MKGPRLAIVLLSVWNILVWLRSTKAITVFRSFGIFTQLGVYSCIEQNVSFSSSPWLLVSLTPTGWEPVAKRCAYNILGHQSSYIRPNRATYCLATPKENQLFILHGEVEESPPISESKSSIIEYSLFLPWWGNIWLRSELLSFTKYLKWIVSSPWWRKADLCFWLLLIEWYETKDSVYLKHLIKNQYRKDIVL